MKCCRLINRHRLINRNYVNIILTRIAWYEFWTLKPCQFLRFMSLHVCPIYHTAAFADYQFKVNSKSITVNVFHDTRKWNNIQLIQLTKSQCIQICYRQCKIMRFACSHTEVKFKLSWRKWSQARLVLWIQIG